MAIVTITPTNNYGGYEYKFVNPIPDRCICRICHLPSKDAYMTGPCCQGLTICKSCLDHWQITAGNQACPVCRKEEGGFHQNYPIAREIRSLHIYCANKEGGCEWEGELNDINNHLGNSEGCQFEEVECSNECGKMIQRQYLTNHVETECPRRKVDCHYCHDTGEHQFIEGQHKEECPKLPLPCPNECGVGSVPRDDMEAHRKECPLEMIQCDYYDVGCEVRIARKDKKEHDDEKMKEHLMNTKHKLADTKTRLANTEESLGDTISKLAIALQRISTLEVLLYLATDKAVAKPTSCAAVLQSSMGWVDKLVTMVMMSKSGDLQCPVVFKLSEYKTKRRDEIEWCSDIFYTHNKGYKMYLDAYAAGYGEGEGTHLSVFLHFMKGPHDDELTWPLRGEFEIKLLNQISDSEHHSITVTFDDDTPEDYNSRVIEGDRSESGWGMHQYIINEDLNKTAQACQFLKDDCLSFQINFNFKA